MDGDLRNLDWGRVQAFLAVARTGSLSAAARELCMSQPTLGRTIKAMENELSVTLFHRRARGLALTETGMELLAPAQAMAEAANQMALSAAGRSETMAGTVRITASVGLALHFLPPVLATIRKEEPEIHIEIASTDETDNLLFREADIALRMFRPTQLDVIAKHIANMRLGLFAAKSYMKDKTEPTTIEEVLAMDLVGYDKEERIIRGLRNLGHHVDRTTFATRCDDHNIIYELVCAGCGLGFLPCRLQDKHPEIIQIGQGLPIPALPLWLAAHEAVRHKPRIRRIWDILTAELPPLLDPPVATD